LHIDIPVDPLSTQLWVQRTANINSAAPGDFIQYKVSVENATNLDIGSVNLVDQLPHGFRLEKGSVLIDGVAANDPMIDTDGTTLTFNLGRMTGTSTHNIEYIANIGAVRRGISVSRSHATVTAVRPLRIPPNSIPSLLKN